MSEFVRNIELMTFNSPATNLSNDQYNITLDQLEKQMQSILNFGSIGFVTFCQADDWEKSFRRNESAGYLVGYEIVNNIGTGAMWLYADIALSPEAIGFRNLFPDLSGFAMRSQSLIIESGYGRIAQIDTIEAFDFTFIKDNSVRTDPIEKHQRRR